MMLDTWDGQIWYPRFYDIDTILSYDNSGEIKFDVDIEMEQGYWNTSSSRLWTKVRDLMHDELVEVYKDMRANGVTYESIMYYMYDEQIAKIPQTYYNKDFDIKYAPYSDQYIGKAHGDGYQHMKRWLKKRFIFCDTLFDYAPSYNNDVLTIRANTLNEMNLTIETYTPLYQHVSFYNGNMEKIKITPGQPATFKGFAQTETDQEVLIYGGSNIKKITGIQSMNPNSMLIGGATRLSELDISNCPILTIVNSNKANFSPHTYLNKLNISNCPQLGGNLNVSNSPLLQEIDARNSAITGLLLPTSLRNLEVMRLPNTIQDLTLYDVPLLHTVELDEGNSLQNLSLSNCSNLTNCINFDLTKVPSISLDNSFDAEELYMSETTNLTLKNMPSLKRVIFTPNSEYSEFDINNIINGKNYKITTFNNPMMTDFITTAPHRNSYNNNDVEWVEEVVGETYVVEQVRGVKGNAQKYTVDIDFNTQYIEVKLDVTKCTTTSNERLIGIGSDNTWSINNTKGFDVYLNSDRVSCLCQYKGNTNNNTYSPMNESNITFKLTKDGFYIDDNLIYDNNIIADVLVDKQTNIIYNSSAYYEYIKISAYELQTIQVKEYGNITPNTVFTANTLDLADTQFQNVKFLCTTDVYNLKVPTTLKNFYCDSAMDIDTDVIEDGSYEVIHEELIEEYTTNYEGEVTLKEEGFFENVVITEWNENTNIHNTGGNLQTNNSYKTSNLIEVKGGTYITHVTSAIDVYQYTEEMKLCYYSGSSRTLQANTKYIRVVAPMSTTDVKISYTGVNYRTPNIIPSSANGSLIFNMYSNNTTQPTSTSPYMWDLTGLKLEDFYTYGMNNWIKTDVSLVYYLGTDKLSIAEGFMYWYYDPFVAGYGNTTQDSLCPIDLGEETTFTISTDGTSTTVGGQFATQSQYENKKSCDRKYQNGSIQSQGRYLAITYPKDATYVDIITPKVGYRILVGNIEDRSLANKNSNEHTELRYARTISITNLTANGILSQQPTSITMPQRMPGYSVRLVNADITPDEYPTMLYPKLIDTTLPITGKLDYTNYKGTSLAWAYAYTTSDVSINPLDSRSQGNITNDYNKLYGTDYVDIVDVWVYKDTDVSKFSTNEAITKAYIELTSANYKTRVDEVLAYYPNCTDVYFFEDGNMNDLSELFIKNTTSRNQIEHITFMEGYFDKVTSIRDCIRVMPNLLTITNLPKNLTIMNQAFYGCDKLIALNAEIPNTVISLSGAFRACRALNQQIDLFNVVLTDSNGLTNAFCDCNTLTIPPILPSNYKGSMGGTFQGCTSLTQAPTIPDGATNMMATFFGCTKLTQAPTIPNGVTDMTNTFNGCTSLIQAPTIPNSVTSLNYTFAGCTSLTQAPTIPQGVTSVVECFRNCSSLTTPPILPNDIQDIRGFVRQCSSLKEVTIPLSNTTMYTDAITDCHGLENVTWVGERTSDLVVYGGTSFALGSNQGGVVLLGEEDIQELVPEHLADVKSLGTTATLTLGETYGSYLTPDEVFSANAKGWTIVGASSDFTIVNASDDVSGYTTDENVTSCFIELTSANYTSRVDEVLQWYPNCTDLYFFDDGSVTSLQELFSSSNNITYTSQLSLIKFMPGYFTNLTTLADRYGLGFLSKCKATVVDVGDLNISKCTSIASAFRDSTCGEIIGLDKWDTSHILSSITTNNTYVFYHLFTDCRAKFDITSWTVGGNLDSFAMGSSMVKPPKIGGVVTALGGAFRACGDLIEPPIFLDDILLPATNASMGSCFYGCKALTQAPVIPQGVTSLSYTFRDCKALTTIDTTNWDTSNVTALDGLFYGCSNLTEIKGIENWNTSKVTGVWDLFFSCGSIEYIDLSKWDMSKMSSTGCMYRYCGSLKVAYLPIQNGTPDNALQGCRADLDIIWVGERSTDLNLGTYSHANGFREEDIQELVPEHLADLHKDEIKISFSNKKITINNTETTWEEE